MRNFGYLAADTAEAAVAIAARDRACRFLAGGTNLVDLMKEGVETPSSVLDIAGLPDMAGIGFGPDGAVGIGALVRNSDLAHHPRVAERLPMLSQALLSGASAQIRNMATVGGNLLQRTRCWYFTTPGYRCNKRRPGAGCAAIDGVNRDHAVLGTSAARRGPPPAPQLRPRAARPPPGGTRAAWGATHRSYMWVALAGLDATVVTLDEAGGRRIDFADFYLLPGDTPERETALRPGELIVAVEVAGDALFARSTYVKLRDRSSYQFALASAAAALEMRGGRITRARLALGGVGTRPWRTREAERLLVGREPTVGSFELAAAAALADARPLRDNAFKIDLARGAIVRAFLHLAGTA